ncbi:hypothetical protein K4K57_009880 [Colletotrichum sp. SAR 10_99]|nr:hypothetical protein K4K55_008803 [Colletotrichum sp. SAR 10_96]KAJ5017044.1 hypothetical protein K4K57_009880 [Colletotrichum sp. SAR 10_99]
MSEGYRGDSSFKAHVHKVTDALRDAASTLELTMGDPTFTTTTHMIDETADSEESSPLSDGNSPSPFKVQYPELKGRSLPPIGQVLKLLRLAQIEKQRFFVDCSVVDEQEFTSFCQRVYFAVNDYSLLSWIIVNIGLFYMFLNLKQPFHSQIGVSYANIHEYSQQLKDNIEAAMQSLRLCNDPSMEACQALALLPMVPDDYVPGVPVHLYAGYIDYAIIVGDMHIQLFSASALQQPQESRIETAKSFARKILQTNKDTKKTGWAMLLNIVGVRADIDQLAIREEALRRLQDFSPAC